MDNVHCECECFLSVKHTGQVSVCSVYECLLMGGGLPRSELFPTCVNAPDGLTTRRHLKAATGAGPLPTAKPCTAEHRVVVRVADLDRPDMRRALGLPTFSTKFHANNGRKCWVSCGAQPPCDTGSDSGGCRCLVTFATRVRNGRTELSMYATVHTEGLAGSALHAGEVA